MGASFLPLDTLVSVCKPLMKHIKLEVKVPGILVIDTPGHELFMNLRRRGGSIADIAILVIDVISGVEPQTIESLEILKERKTPFIIALNKIDLIPGWRPHPDACFLDSISKQSRDVEKRLDEHMYRTIGQLSNLGFRADRFDNISDFRRIVAVVPVSAKTGEGIPELLAVLIGLVQQYLSENLRVSEGPAKGVVLEVVEEEGLGTTINTIIYDGVLHKNDEIVIGGLNGPIVTHIKALLIPKPLDEMRDPREKFKRINEVSAAAGVKIAAPNLDEALAGAPLYAVSEDISLEEVIGKVSSEVSSLRIHTESAGLVVKADTLGSLEAIINALRRREYPVRLADVGDVSKRDVTEASVSSEELSLRAILAFNVRVLPDAELLAREFNIPIFQGNVIYRLLDEFIEWSESVRRERVEEELSKLIHPGVIRLLPGYVFRRSKPAIAGFRVEYGQIAPGVRLIRADDGKPIGSILQIQDKGKAIPTASKGMEIAVSIDKGVIGRNMHEGDVFYVDVPESHVRILLSKFRNMLSEDELKALDLLIELKRKGRRFWGY